MKVNSLLLGLLILLVGILIAILVNPSVVREYIPVIESPDIVYVRDTPWWGGGLPWGHFYGHRPYGGRPHHPPPPPPSPPSPPPSPPPLPPTPPPGAAPPAPQPMGFLDMSELKEGFASCPYKN